MFRTHNEFTDHQEESVEQIGLVMITILQIVQYLLTVEDEQIIVEVGWLTRIQLLKVDKQQFDSSFIQLCLIIETNALLDDLKHKYLMRKSLLSYQIMDYL